MAINVMHGRTDKVINGIMEALKRFQANHSQTQIDIYRQNKASVRIRIIDPQFAGKGKPERSRLVWEYLEELPEDVQGEISMLLLLSPDETKTSLANFEFETAVPWTW